MKAGTEIELMSAPLRILLVDDDRDDFALTRDLVEESFGKSATLDWAASYDEGIEALRRQSHDVCLLDYRLGAHTGLDLLQHAAAAQYDAPIILLTGEGEREVDLAAMEAGAADFLQKSGLAAVTLERAIRHAVERHRDRRALHQLNELLESRVEMRTLELERANASLREADRRKDEFLATLAHELRNPLAPIANSLAVLRLMHADPKMLELARQTMERQLAHMVRLIDDLLDVSRISRGKIELRKSPIDLASIVLQAVEAIRPNSQQRQLNLEVDLPNEPIYLSADATRLVQVIGNLLNNACKFTDPGGTVRIDVAADAQQAVIRVVDTGIGLAAEQLPRIFEMFAQIHSPLERGESGLGIGLTLARNLVELHGGSIEASSPGLGQGSEFVVRLPTADQPAVVRAAPGDVANDVPSLGAQKILVVDDNRDSAASLSMLLKLASSEVYMAHDGLEALRLAEQIRPDVVVLDIGLPGMNGYEVAKEIRNFAWGKNPYLVALTGWGQKEDRQKAIQAGFDQHLTKPVEHTRLMELLSQATGREESSATESPAA
jgi:signal transduction histidine kinase